MVWVLLVLVATVGVCWAVWRLERDRSPPHSDQAADVSGFDWLKEDTRSLGLHLCAGKGSGKSFVVGKDLCFRTFLSGVGQLIIEPTGALCDYFLDKLIRFAAQLPPEERAVLFSRVRYIDMAGSDGHVTCWPLYYPLGNESLFSIAQRPIETMLRTDVNLHSAPLEGANAVKMIGNMCMILIALDMQISEAENLLRNPKLWKEKGLFDEAIRRYPEVEPAVKWFLETYIPWSSDFKMRRTSAFRNKIDLYSLDPIQRAIYGGSTGLDFAELEQGITWLVDFRHVTNKDQRRWGMMWVLQWFLSHVLNRPLRGQPIHLCIDELGELSTMDIQSAHGEDLFGADLDNLINRQARNHNIYCTFIHQEMFQMSEKMQKALMTCGNQMIGYQSDLDGAMSLAKYFFPYDGKPLIKRWDPIFAGSLDGPIEVAQRPVEYTSQEAQLLASNAFTRLPGWHFWVRGAVKEGTITGKLQLMRVVRDLGQWVQQDKVAALRRQLSRQGGRLVESVLKEIDDRQQLLRTEPVKAKQTGKAVEPTESVNQDAQSATMPKYDRDGYLQE